MQLVFLFLAFSAISAAYNCYSYTQMSDDQFIYDSVSSFQILQRDAHTNKAYVRQNGLIVEYKTGGPYTILNCHDIYVGDIWVMAGQSNMRGHGYYHDRFEPAPLQNNTTPIPSIHLFNSEESWQVASDPTHRLALSSRIVHHTLPDPTVKHPELLAYRGASLGPAFAERYQKLNDNVPVGLVASAHGGTSLDNWKRPALIDADTVNTTLYGAMLDRIRKVGRVAGVLWYQGESDATLKDSTTYYTRFQEWMEILRQDLGKNVPFAFVQIGAHRVDDPEMAAGWIEVQDAQRRLFDCHPNTAAVASLDGGLDDRVHLSAAALRVVGERLAIAAHDAKLGKGSAATPLPVHVRLDNNPLVANTPPSIVISFEHMESINWKNGLDDEIFGFEVICKEPKVTLLGARVQQDRKTIRLYLSDNTTSPISVLYGMNQKAINLIASNDMTAPAFKLEI